AKNDMEVIPLRNALSDNLANLLYQALAVTIVPPTAPPATLPGAGGVGGVGGGALPAAAPGVGLGAGAFGGAKGALGATGGVGQVYGGGQASKDIGVRLLADNGQWIATGFSDVYIFSDNRTNSIILNAPQHNFVMLKKLIQELDKPPTYAAK